MVNSAHPGNSTGLVSVMGFLPSQNSVDSSTDDLRPSTNQNDAKLFSSKGIAKINAVHERIHRDWMCRDAEERVLLYNFNLEAQLQERNQKERDWNAQCREAAICTLTDQTQAIAEAPLKMGHPALPPSPEPAVYLEYRECPRALKQTSSFADSLASSLGQLHPL